MSEHDHFIRTICESPQDDSLRLIYADWLEERGECGRAEFIRVQCELAVTQRNLTFPAEAPERWADRRKTAKIYGENPRWNTLRRRERELLEPGSLRHLPGPFWIRGTEYGWSFGEGVARVSFACAVRRGFVSHVECTLADWMGNPRIEDCPACLADYRRHDGRYTCNGSCNARIGHGPALVLAAPIVSVRLTDREPLRFSGRYLWHPDARAEHQHDYLPQEIFDQLRGHDHRPAAVLRMVKGFTTAAAAHTALSDVLVRWAREAAGLPGLEATHAL